MVTDEGDVSTSIPSSKISGLFKSILWFIMNRCEEPMVISASAIESKVFTSPSILYRLIVLCVLSEARDILTFTFSVAPPVTSQSNLKSPISAYMGPRTVSIILLSPVSKSPKATIVSMTSSAYTVSCTVEGTCLFTFSTKPVKRFSKLPILKPLPFIWTFTLPLLSILPGITLVMEGLDIM